MLLKHKNSKINKSILVAKQLIQAQKRRENLKKQTSSISNDYIEQDTKSIKSINSDESKYFINNRHNNNDKENQSKIENNKKESDCEEQEKNQENSSNFHIGYTINYNDETYKNDELMNSDLTIINSNRSYNNTMSNKNLNQKELFSLNNQLEIDENQYLTIRIYLFNTNIYLKYSIRHSLSVNVLELKTCLLKTIKENKLFDLKDIDNKYYEIRLTSIRDDNTIGVNYNHPALNDSQEISYSSDWLSLALIRIKKSSFPKKESKENIENHIENEKEKVKFTLGKTLNKVRFLFHIKFYKFNNIKSNPNPHSNDVYIEEEANEDLTLEMILERNEKKLKLNQYKKYFYFTLHEHFPMKTTRETNKTKENNIEFDEEDCMIDDQKGNNSFVLDSSQLELSMKISEISIYEIDLYIRKFHDCSIGNINILLLNNNINSNDSVNESTTSSSKRNSETFSNKKEENVKEYENENENNSNTIDNDRVRIEKSSDLYKIEMSSKNYKGFLYNKSKSKGKSKVIIKIDRDYISFTPPKNSTVSSIKKREIYDYIMGWWDELEYYKYRPIVLIKNIIKYMKIEDCFILIEYKDNFKIKQIYFELEDKLERKDLLYKLKHFMVSL